MLSALAIVAAMAAIDGRELDRFVEQKMAAFADVVVTVDDDVLVLARTIKQGFPTRDSPIPPPAPPARFQFYAQDRLVRIDGPFRGTTAEFIREEDGGIGWLRFGGRIHRR